MTTALQALKDLREGNRRFAAGAAGGTNLELALRRRDLVNGQSPKAAILGCSDSRVPAEFVFDQGLGDLFVIRVAGNVVAPSQIGSIEYAVEALGTRLVVVLGHSNCGAVQATLDALHDSGADCSRNLGSILDRIRPSVLDLLEVASTGSREELLRRAVRANVRHSVDRLSHGSEIIEDFVQREGLLIVGAEYSLESGRVEFFEGLPPEA